MKVSWAFRYRARGEGEKSYYVKNIDTETDPARASRVRGGWNLSIQIRPRSRLTSPLEGAAWRKKKKRETWGKPPKSDNAGGKENSRRLFLQTETSSPARRKTDRKPSPIFKERKGWGKRRFSHLEEVIVEKKERRVCCLRGSRGDSTARLCTGTIGSLAGEFLQLGRGATNSSQGGLY